MSGSNSSEPLKETATESAKQLFKEIIENYIRKKPEEIDIDNWEEKITEEINEGSLTLQVIVIWLYYLPKNLSLEKPLDENRKAIDKLEKKVETILPSIRSEVDRMTNYNNELYELFKERLDGIKQDLNGLRDRDVRNLVTKGDFIDLNSKVGRLPTLDDLTNKHSPLATKIDLSTTQTTLSELNSKVEKIPTLDDLTNEHSPLATKSKLSAIEENISFLKGRMSIQLWGEIVGIICTIGLILATWQNISSKITQGLSPSLNLPTQKVNPKPSP